MLKTFDCLEVFEISSVRDIISIKKIAHLRSIRLLSTVYRQLYTLFNIGYLILNQIYRKEYYMNIYKMLQGITCWYNPYQNSSIHFPRIFILNAVMTSFLLAYRMSIDVIILEQFTNSIKFYRFGEKAKFSFLLPSQHSNLFLSSFPSSRFI